MKKYFNDKEVDDTFEYWRIRFGGSIENELPVGELVIDQEEVRKLLLMLEQVYEELIWRRVSVNPALCAKCINRQKQE